jgi:hypothetical protein
MAADDAAPAAQPPAEERGAMGLVKQASLVVGLAAAVVGLVTGIVALVDRLTPEPEPVKSIAMPEPDLETGITFAQYLDRVDRGPCTLEPAVCGERGAMVEFTVEATGYKGKELTLKWELIDLGTGNEVRESDAFTITPAAPTDTVPVPPIFTAFPDQGGPLQFRAELFDVGGDRIGRARSAQFERE